MDSSMGSNMTCVKDEASDHRITLEPDGSIYHEKQSRELCALHALNNLCQDRIFTKRDLDNICYKLSPEAYVNPHKSMFGLGNYDVNVIMAALQTKNLDTLWFDKRKDITGLVMDNIQGLILNIPMDYKWGILHLPLRRKHWIVIRQIGIHYYNLDSKLELPECIGTLAEVKKYLQEQMGCKDKELLLVVNQLVSASGSWWRPGHAASEQNGHPASKNRSSHLSNEGDNQDQEMELSIDTHILSNELVEKPEHLKKYHQDYVPIEIHRTYHKRDSSCSSKEFNVDKCTELVPVEVEDTTKVSNSPKSETRKGNDCDAHINSDNSAFRPSNGDAAVVVVKQADNCS